jgi:hypothetical protein
MAPLQELIALSLLAGLGFGLALARDDLFFSTVFGIASATATVGHRESARWYRGTWHCGLA